MAPVIYTIGYELDKTPDSLVARLTAAGVTRLVDIRELPISRRRGFAKTALSAALAEVGIRYEHQRALGNPKPSRDLYRSGRQAEGERQYLAHVRIGASSAVDALAESLDSEPSCVMCFEHDYRTCHRDIVVAEVARRRPDLRVEHL